MGARQCCGSCEYCQDCSSPTTMHAILVGMADDTCTSCTDLNGVEIVSSLMTSDCSWLWTNPPVGADCYQLTEAAWSVSDCRVAFTIQLDECQQFNFWHDFSEAPDCWGSEESPLQLEFQQFTECGNPSKLLCANSATKVLVWGTDV